MYYDAHTHLNSDEIFPLRQEHLERFISTWGKWLVTVGTNKLRNHRAIEIAGQWTGIAGTCTDSAHTDFILKTTAGYHPWEVSYWHISSQHDILQAQEDLRALLDTPLSRAAIVAIGECGTDLHYTTTPQQHLMQQDLFAMQCRLAQEYSLPVVVHTRDDFEWTRDIVKQFPDVRFYFHCRSYTPHEAERICAAIPDHFFGFCGNTTYPKATQIRDSLAYLVSQSTSVLPDCILLETDAPYLAPQPQRGQQNAPEYISWLYSYLSEFLSVTPQTLQTGIEQNFLRCYSLTTDIATIATQPVVQ